MLISPQNAIVQLFGITLPSQIFLFLLKVNPLIHLHCLILEPCLQLRVLQFSLFERQVLCAGKEDYIRIKSKL